MLHEADRARQTITVEPQPTGFGASITGLDLSKPLPPAVLDEVRTAWARHGVVAFPGQPLALIREGGSIPIVNTFRQILGVETLLLGLALPDCRAHAPDENFPVENFEAGIRLNKALLEELARG